VSAPLPEIDPASTIEVITAFIRSQLRQTGFERLVVALSGGVDSATVAFLAARAVGPDNLLAVRMPYRTSSPDSEADAMRVVSALGCRTERVEITPMVDPMLSLVSGEDEATLRVRHGGNGPPLLLLHGHPQTHLMWHAVAPGLADRFTVVAPDLRGYGESTKPETTPDHEPYSKRAMARDQVELMRQYGFERFFVCGHDRGARCAYRLTLDHPESVAKLAVLDIVPTGDAFRLAANRFRAAVPLVVAALALFGLVPTPAAADGGAFVRVNQVGYDLHGP